MFSFLAGWAGLHEGLPEPLAGACCVLCVCSFLLFVCLSFEGEGGGGGGAGIHEGLHHVPLMDVSSSLFCFCFCFVLFCSDSLFYCIVY